MEVAFDEGNTSAIEAVHGRKCDAAVHRVGLRQGEVSVGGTVPPVIVRLRAFCARSRGIPGFLSIL